MGRRRLGPKEGAWILTIRHQHGTNRASLTSMGSHQWPSSSPGSTSSPPAKTSARASPWTPRSSPSTSTTSATVEHRKDYQEPARFFERTYLTRNLKDLAAQAVRRLSGITVETSAVFNMATQFGGGKTHSLTLLYHLAQVGPAAHDWQGVAIDPRPSPGQAGAQGRDGGLRRDQKFDSLHRSGRRTASRVGGRPGARSPGNSAGRRRSPSSPSTTRRGSHRAAT